MYQFLSCYYCVLAVLMLTAKHAFKATLNDSVYTSIMTVNKGSCCPCTLCCYLLTNYGSCMQQCLCMGKA